jgi:hypothetical protein
MISQSLLQILSFRILRGNEWVLKVGMARRRLHHGGYNRMSPVDKEKFDRTRHPIHPVAGSAAHGNLFRQRRWSCRKAAVFMLQQDRYC